MSQAISLAPRSLRRLLKYPRPQPTSSVPAADHVVGQKLVDQRFDAPPGVVVRQRLLELVSQPLVAEFFLGDGSHGCVFGGGGAYLAQKSTSRATSLRRSLRWTTKSMKPCSWRNSLR